MGDSGFNGDNTVVEEDYDKNFFGDYWQWYQQTPIFGDDGVPVPPMNFYYNVRYVLKRIVAACFDTIFQCFFKCTAMNGEVFKILAFQSNKYTQDDTRQSNSNLFIGQKWKIEVSVKWFIYLGSC